MRNICVHLRYLRIQPISVFRISESCILFHLAEDE